LLFESLAEMRGVSESPEKCDISKFSVLHMRIQEVASTQIQSLVKNVLVYRFVGGFKQPMQVPWRHTAGFRDLSR